MIISAYVFVPLIAASWMIGFGVACVASDAFLTIVESTAAGVSQSYSQERSRFRRWIRDGVTWPDDTFLDAFCKGFYFVYLLMLSFIPGMIASYFFFGKSPWATVFSGLVFSLSFPIVVLSSLMASSGWVPFWPRLILCYLQRPGKALAFHVLSLPFLAACFLVLDLALLRTGSTTMMMAIGLCPLGVIAFFIYARLLGRFAFALSFTRQDDERQHIRSDNQERPSPRARKKKKPTAGPKESATPLTDRLHTWGLPTQEHDEHPLNAQPSALGAITTPDGEVTGYNVDFSGNASPEPPKVETKIHRFDEDDDEPIVVGEVQGLSTTQAHDANRAFPVHERELKLYLRDRPQEPGNPYGVEVITFFIDTKTLVPLIIISSGVIVLTFMQRLMDSMRPG